MRCFWVLLLSAACGSHQVGQGAPDAPPSSDAPSSDACSADNCCSDADCANPSYVCQAHQCVDVAGSLSALSWQLPCGAAVGARSCAAPATATSSTTVGGTAGYTYDITVHLLGVLEQKTYTGGCQDSYWLSGGNDNGDSFNVYELSISSPPQHYFLNAGTSNIANCYVIDYDKTFRADAGAMVTLYAASNDDQEIMNLDAGGNPLTVSGTNITQPFNGQFIEMDVISVAPDPIATGATVGAGSASSALAVAGAQELTIADAPSLEPADVTLETWFDFAAAPAGYGMLVGKGYSTGVADSWGLWYESGALHAGMNLASTASSATVPWTIATGEWHHAAMTYDSGTQVATFYIDGFASACATNTAPVYDATPMRVGADSESGGIGGYVNGALDEVRVFASARSADQVWADLHTHQLGATSSLVGEWTFDEATGQTAADDSGNANTATFGADGSTETADPSWISSTVPH